MGRRADFGGVSHTPRKGEVLLQRLDARDRTNL
jgi:hypothetical protein